MTDKESKGKDAKNRFLCVIFGGDAWLNMILIFLVVVSCVEVYSALNSGFRLFRDYDAQLKSHILKLMAGVGLAVVCQQYLDVRKYKILIFIGMIGMWVLLVLATFTGSSVNGASRYFLGIQPSEFIKIFLVCFLSFWISEQYGEKGIVWHKTGFMIAVCALVIVPVMLENMSNGLLIFAVWVSMLLLAGLKIRYVLIAMAIGLVVGTGAYQAYKHFPSEVTSVFHRAPTWAKRIDTFLGTEKLDEANLDWSENYQVYHSKIAVANSEIIGKGPGNGRERQILPQSFSDFIFSIIVEELGIVGFVLVIGAYVLLVWRAFQLAMYCDDVISKFILFGCSLMISYQALINISVGVSAMPVTGQPLPMVSRGGSSMFVTGVFFGIMQNVCKRMKEKQKKAETGLVRVTKSEEVV